MDSGFDPSRGDPLPTKEQIWAIDDLSALHGLRDSIVEVIKSIEVDLEFRSDDAADDFWERRARKALALHRSCEVLIAKRIKYVERGGPAPAADPNIKLKKVEARAQIEAALAEQQRAKQLADREKTLRTVINGVGQQSFHAAFYSVVRDHMDRETFGALVVKAREEAEGRFMRDLPAIATETRRAETSEAGSVHEGAGPQDIAQGDRP